MTRPRANSVLSDMVQHDICSALLMGATFNHACEAAGIRLKTAEEWLTRGRNYDRELEAGRDPKELDAPFFDFMCAVEESRNQARCRVASVIMRGILGDIEYDKETGKETVVHREPDTRLAMQWLERQDPAHWGRTWRPEAVQAEERGRSIEEALAHGEQLVAQAAEQIAKNAARRKR